MGFFAEFNTWLNTLLMNYVGSNTALVAGAVGAVAFFGGVAGGCVRRVGARAVELDGGLRDGGLSVELTAVASDVLDGGDGEARLADGTVSTEGVIGAAARASTAGAECPRHETAPMNPATRATPIRLDTTTSVPRRFEAWAGRGSPRASAVALPREDEPVAMAGSLGTVWANATP